MKHDDIANIEPTLEELNKIEEENIEVDKLEDYINDGDLRDSVRMYLLEIQRWPLMNKEEEVELAKKIELGDMSAKTEFINRNLRLVPGIARKYMLSRNFFLDLIQEGNIGLMKAVDKFDYKLGYKFSTYAIYWIRQYISRYIASNASTVKLSKNKVDKYIKLKSVMRELTSELQCTPTCEQIAEKMKLSVGEVIELKSYGEAVENIVYIDTPINSLEERTTTTIGDMIESKEKLIDVVMKNELRHLLFKALDNFSEKDREVFILRFGLNDGKFRSLEEVGKKYNITRERVRQIEAKGLRRLRNPKYRKYFEGFI